MKNKIKKILKESLGVQENFISTEADRIAKGALMLAGCLASGHKILIFGNGGSAADSQHIAAEFINRFAMERPGLAAIALTCDTSVLTAISNDYSFDNVFSRQIESIGRPGDLAWGISTSGKSENVIKAMDKAHEMGLSTMIFTGKDGGDLKDRGDMVYIVRSEITARIQECHILTAHILCGLVEKTLFPES